MAMDPAKGLSDLVSNGSGSESLPSLEQLNNLWKTINQQPQSTVNDNEGKKPPPLPPRPDSQVNPRSNYLSSDMNYGGYGYGGHSLMNPFSGGIGGYGGYGGYGAGYGGYGYGSRYGMYGQGNPSDENDFVRVAEESSRQAFQSIESIVHAFGSVSMMLESTYFAVHSSFRAVLGVADHISRLRGHMTQVVSSMTIIRSLSLFIRRLAFILGLRDIDPSNEAAWREASLQQKLTPEAMAEALIKPDKKSSWPIMMFFAVVFGTPWLIWKLLISLSGGSQTNAKWMSGQGDHYVAKALYDFVTNSPREVSFTTGQQLIIAPKDKQPNVRGWLLASVDGVKVGLIPASYVEIIAFSPSDTSSANGISSSSSVTVPVDPVIPLQPVSVKEGSLSKQQEPSSSQTTPVDQKKSG